MLALVKKVMMQKKGFEIMKMEKKQFRIGELADKLAVERFVIRFWEKEFGLSATRSPGGQRFYTQEDYDTFAQIKQLLYKEKFTIQGAKKKLSLGAQRTTMEETPTQKQQPAQKTNWDQRKLIEQLSSFRTQLKKLKELL